MAAPYARRLLPRHSKGYLWLCFLVLVFGSMLLSDNGYSLYNMLCAPLFKDDIRTSVSAPAPFKVVNLKVGGAPNAIEPLPYATSAVAIPSEEVPVPTKQQAPLREPEKLSHTTAPLIDEAKPQKPLSRPSNEDEPTFGHGSTAFKPSEVLIMFKTGATSLWRRVPIYLSTTFANASLTPNVALYSDRSDHIAGRPIIDVLANVSSALKASPDFELYRKSQEARESNLYLEAAAIDGDTYLPGGWRLDKYKFLPLVQHAADNYRGLKWYVYMEDDNYFFWNSLFTWLGTFDPSTPLFLGSPAARLGEDFAGGGSGFAISGAAMKKTFGNDPELARKWEGYAEERCCGDQVVSHVMAEMGVPRDRRYDHSEWAGLQSLPTWKMGFGEWNWCSPLYNVHKTHQADASELFVFEKEFQKKHGDRTVLRYHNLFSSMISPYLIAQRSEWDNEASEKWFASRQEDPATLESLTPAQRSTKPWFSMKACKQACEDWDGCLSWKYADDNCGLGSTVARGRRVEEGIFVTSGWMMERIKMLEKKECGEVKL